MSTGSGITGNSPAGAGYDVLVWVDDEGDVVCCGYTRKGQNFLRTLNRDYNNGDIMELVGHPRAFKAQIPNNIQVGLLMRPSGKIKPMDGPRLQ